MCVCICPLIEEAFIFPWATEGATRPKGPYSDLVPFSPPWLKSVLYNETDPEAKATAKAALLRGKGRLLFTSLIIVYRMII